MSLSPGHSPLGRLLLVLALTLLAIPAVAGEALPDITTTGQTFWVASKAFREQRQVQVYLPSSYQLNDSRYPVLYLLDGDAYYTVVAGLVRNLSESSGRIPEMIVVSIPNVARQRELAVPLRSPKAEDVKPTGDVFHQFLATDLIPWVEAHYRTAPFRILIGHSLGGLYSVYTLLNWPNTFDAYLALSPALWFDDQNIMRDAESKLRGLPPGRSTRFLYLMAAHESVEITEPAAHLAKLLQETRPRGLQWSYEFLEKENHMSSFVPGTLAGLQALFSGLQVPEPVILAEGLAGVEKHYAGLKDIYGFELRPSYAMLNWMGGFLMQQQRKEQAEVFFARAKALYPQHPELLRDWPARSLRSEGVGQAAAADALAALDARIDPLFEPWTHSDTPGCALSITQDGVSVLERAYGLADLEQGVAIRTSTVFNVGSMSKQFTAAAILLLQEEGKLSLDDDVRRYIPELPAYGTPITLRQLAHHTSGLRDLPELLAYSGWNWVDDVPLARVLELLARQKRLNFAPGSAYSYSNSGYILLGEVVHRVSGQSLGAFSQQHIFEPLGMLHSRFYDHRSLIVPGRAAGYLKRDEGGYGAWRPTYEIVGDGGLLTTLQDLAVWERNLLQPRLGRDPRQLAAALMQPGTLNDGTPIEYGLALVSGDYRGLPTISHGGAVPGYKAFMLRFPEQGAAIHVLCNAGDIPVRALAKSVADAYLDGRFPRGPDAAPDGTAAAPAVGATKRMPSSESLRKYAGTFYSSEVEARQVIRIDGEGLAVTVGYLAPMHLARLDTEIFEGPDHVRYTFTPARGGHAAGFEIDSEGVRGLQFRRVQ